MEKTRKSYSDNDCCDECIEYGGETHRVVEWSRIIGINAHCLINRKNLGWTIEEILTTPLGGKRNKKNKLQANLCNEKST